MAKTGNRSKVIKSRDIVECQIFSLGIGGIWLRMSFLVVNEAIKFTCTCTTNSNMQWLMYTLSRHITQQTEACSVPEETYHLKITYQTKPNRKFVWFFSTSSQSMTSYNTGQTVSTYKNTINNNIITFILFTFSASSNNVIPEASTSFKGSSSPTAALYILIAIIGKVYLFPHLFFKTSANFYETKRVE